jgi:hypothetical protein
LLEFCWSKKSGYLKTDILLYLTQKKPIFKNGKKIGLLAQNRSKKIAFLKTEFFILAGAKKSHI